MDTALATISCVFSNEKELYQAYMSFVKNGGLFFKTKQNFDLGDNLDVEITFPGGKKAEKFVGKVIWKTPLEVQAQFHVGIGVQIVGKEAKAIRDKIEVYLAGSVMSDKRTDTL